MPSKERMRKNQQQKLAAAIDHFLLRERRFLLVFHTKLKKYEVLAFRSYSAIRTILTAIQIRIECSFWL